MDDNEIQDAESNLEPERPPAQPVAESTGIPWAAVFILIWAVLLIIFSVQNAEETTVEFLGWDVVMPVALLVMVTALLTLILTGLASAFYRRKRRKRLQEKRALQEMKAIESNGPSSQ